MRTPIFLWAAPTIALATAVGLAYWSFWRPAPPKLRKATLLAALDVYKTAWEQQDCALILTIFTEDAVYHERVLQEPIRGHEGIAAYWEGPPPEAYSRVTNPERFRPLHDVALRPLDELEATFDVQRQEAYGLDHELERGQLVRPTVKLIPGDPGTAPMVVVFSAFPGV